jgi:AcrR family transcriptional regulator
MEDTKQTEIEAQIVDAANKVFLEKGFNETHMSMIAEAAGINRPTLYYYYRTKEKLFQSVFKNIVSSFIPRVVDILHEDIPIKERLTMLVDTYLEAFINHPNLPAFIIKEIKRDSGHLIKTVYELHLESYLNEVINVINTEKEKGTIKDIPLFSIFFTLYGLLATPFLTRDLAETIFLKPALDSGKTGLPFQNGKPVSPWHVACNYKELIRKWEPYAVSQLCFLMLK